MELASLGQFECKKGSSVVTLAHQEILESYHQYWYQRQGHQMLYTHCYCEQSLFNPQSMGG